MKYEFDSSHGKYIKISVSGPINKTDLVTAIAELMKHPEYLHKHSLWDFSAFSLGLSMEDLKDIANILHRYKAKENDFANKSALVLSGKTYEAIARIFIMEADELELPFEYRTFTDEVEAIAFLCSE